MAVITIFLMGAVYCLAVPGRIRSYTKAAVAAVVVLFGLARLYLGVDHPDDVLLGVAFAMAIAVTAFRFFTPERGVPRRLSARPSGVMAGDQVAGSVGS